MSEETQVPAEDEKLPEETVIDEVEETTDVEETTEETEEEVAETVEPAPEREVYTMSVSKAQKEKKNALERQKEEMEEKHALAIEALKSEDAPKQADELDVFAEEQGIDPEVMKKLVAAAQKPFTDKISKVDSLLEEKEKEANFAKTSMEFDDKVSQLIKQDYPTASPEHIAKVKKEVVDLAFSENYHTYKLEDIYKVNKSQFEFKDNYTGEPSDGNTVDIIDFDNMSDAQEHELAHSDPDKYAKFVAHQDAKNSSYIDA